MDWHELVAEIEALDGGDPQRAALVEEFMAARQEYWEDHHVEAKQLRYSGGKLAPTDKGLLAKTASAFANAALRAARSRRRFSLE